MSEDHLSLFDEGQEARPKRRRNRRPLLIGLSVLTVLILALVGVAGYYGKSMLDSLDSIKRDPTLMPTENRPEPVQPQPGSGAAPINFVLMGSDTLGGERGRSDVLQLLHISGDRKAAFLMSIPRDSWVDVPGHGKAKVNAAYSWGGPALTVATLEQMFQVPMDHTVIIDFEGFIKVIDALGGVTVNNRTASSSGGFEFPKGEITLTGDSALQFVRERKNLPDGDFGRAQRQRDVVMAVVKKLSSRGVLANPGLFNEALAELGPNFTVDEALTNTALVTLALELKDVSGNISSMVLPNLGSAMEGSQSVVRVDWDAVAELQTALRDDDIVSFYAKYGK